jgi:hypothetical protein
MKADAAECQFESIVRMSKNWANRSDADATPDCDRLARNQTAVEPN